MPAQPTFPAVALRYPVLLCACLLCASVSVAADPASDQATYDALAAQGAKALAEAKAAVLQHPELAAVATPEGAVKLLTPEGQAALAAPIVEKDMPVLMEKLAEVLPETAVNLQVLLDAYARNDWSAVASAATATAQVTWAELQAKFSR